MASDGEQAGHVSRSRRIEEMKLMAQGEPTPVGLISIENFDPYKPEPPYLSSPRSLEACRINGVQENELLILPLEYFLETSKDSMEATQMRYHRFEELRRRYVSRIRNTRMELIRGEMKAKMEGGGPRSIEQIRKEFEESIKAQEQAYLERLRRRQQKELQQVMMYEIRVSAMQERKRREQLEAEEKEREEKRRQALQKRRADERKMKAEARERERQHQAELHERRGAAKLFEEYKAQAIAKEREVTAARKKTEAREAAHVKAHEEHIKATHEIFEWQRKVLEEKDQKIKEQDERRRQKLQERRWLRAMQVARQKEQYKQKVARVAEVKKELVEVKKAETLRWLMAKDAVVQEYRERMMYERMMERSNRQSHRQDVSKRYNNQQGDGLEEIRRRMAHKEEVFRQQQERLMTMLELKKARNRLKEDEIRVFMEQKDKADDYRKVKMAEKLAFQDERFKMREDVRLLLASTRLTANRTSLQKKEQIMHQFDRLMSNSRLDEEDLIKAVQDFLNEGSLSAHNSAHNSVTGEEKGDEKDDFEDESTEGEGKEKEGKEKGEKRDKEASDLLPHLVAPLMNHSALSVGSHETLSVETGKNEGNIITPGGKPLANNGPPSPSSPTSRANNHPNNGSQHRATPAVKTKKHAAGGGFKKPSKYVPRIPPQLAYEILEQLRKDQNEELKKLLIQEQVAENQREAQLLATTDPGEQLRLETVVFAMQRAEASDRIIAMTETHEQALQKRKAELEAITLPPVSSMR